MRKATNQQETASPVTAKNVLEVLKDDVFPGFFAEELDHFLVYKQSAGAAANGYRRTELPADLVVEAVNAVRFTYDSTRPALSKVSLDPGTLLRVEVLKHIVYLAVTLSPRLRVSEYRGGEIVKEIFAAIVHGDGHRLMPDDYQELYRRFASPEETVARHRVVCDFIAGMTDNYAVEFYARLKSENARTIFKPF